MAIHLIAVGFLILAFVITTIKPINLGLICMAGVLIIGVGAGGLPAEALYSGFPANLFVLLVGVTLLFNLASENGTIDWMIGRMVRAVRGSNAMIPWVMFAITGIFSAIGNAYAVPIMSPIALRYAQRNGISQFFMGLMVIHGCLAGALSPISLYGLIIHGILVDNGIPSNPILLFVIGLSANLIIAVLVFVVAISKGAHKLEVTAEAKAELGDDDLAGLSQGPRKLGYEQYLSLASIAFLIIGSLVFGLDIGLLAMGLGLIIALVRPARLKPALTKVPWEVVLLVCGVLTYVGVMRELGTIDFVGESVTAIGMPFLAALLLGYVGAVISAFATSSGVITALVPLAMPLLAGSSISSFAVIALLGVTSTIVDVSPFSTNGAMVVANTLEKDRVAVLRKLIIYGGLVVLLAPPLVWAIVVVPTGF